MPYNTGKIVSRKCITVGTSLTFLQANASKGVFTANLNVPFQPDELTVRNITYASTGNEPNGFKIVCDQLNNVTIGTAYDSCAIGNSFTASITTNLTAQNQWTFRVLTYDDKVPTDGDFMGTLFITLEFVKYDS